MRKTSFASIFLFLSALFLLPTSKAQEKSCIAQGCHASLLKKFQVHPPAEEDCSTCHESSSQLHPEQEGEEFQITAEVPELCFSCHDPFEDGSLHAPVEGGECLSCHDPHAADTEPLIRAESIGQACLECHDLPLKNAKTVHAPVDAMECTGCHSPHYARLLQDSPFLCLQCHGDVVENKLVEDRHPPTEDCLNCHQPHASQVPGLLTQTPPDLCVDCHADQLPDSSEVTSLHGALKEGKACVACHRPHVSDFDHFLRTEGTELCLSCHDRKIEAGKRTIPNIAAKIRGRNIVHAPVEAEGCLVCHRPHFSDQANLLNDAFPGKRYPVGEEATYQLCFNCHDSQLMTKEQVVDETNFRDGMRNLHYVHVNREKSRRCTFCHDVHGSPNEHLLQSETLFGQWELPIRYQPMEGGGACSPGCHERKEYKIYK
jgi:predicted CXXCH cytochrome family protein